MVDWRGRWTRDPASAALQADGSLIVEAVERSDWWRDTAYGFRHDDGHALLRPWESGTAVQVSFVLDGFSDQFDQAGVLVRVDDANWVKAGVELSDGHPHLGAVVTVGASDWSTGRVDDWIGRIVTVRVSRVADAVVVRARAAHHDGPADAPGGVHDDWHLVRVARFPHEHALIGPMLCAPTRAGFRVRFVDWRITAGDESLHL